MSQPLDREPAPLGDVAGRGARGRPLGARVQGPPLHGRRHRRRRAAHRAARPRAGHPGRRPRSRGRPSRSRRGRGQGARRLGAASPTDVLRAVRELPGALLHPRRRGPLGVDDRRGSRPVRRSPDRHATAVDRGHHRSPPGLGPLVGRPRRRRRRSGSAFGGTVNDVVLAAVSGGLPRRCSSPAATIRRPGGGPLAGAGLGPSRRRPRRPRQPGVGPAATSCPVHVDDPVERLALVHEQMAELKASHMAEAGEWPSRTSATWRRRWWSAS